VLQNFLKAGVTMPYKNFSAIKIKMFLKTAISILLILIFNNEICAEEFSKTNQDSDFIKSYSLQECIDIALKNNFNSAASKQEIEIAEFQYKQALSAYWPQLLFNSSFSRLSDDPNFIFPPQPMNLGGQSVIFAQSIANSQLAKQGITPTTVGQAAFNTALDQTTQQVLQGLVSTPMPEWDVKIMDRNTITNSINLTFPVYTGGKINSVVEQAAAGIEVAKQNSKKTDLQVIYDVKKYYSACVLSDKLKNIGETALARLEATLELTEHLYKNGSGKVKKTDYLRNKMIVDGIRAGVALLKGNSELAYAALINALGINQNIKIEISDKELKFNPYNISLEQLLSNSYKFNPDWAMLKSGLKAAESKIKETQSENYPKIGIFGSLNCINNSYQSGIMSDENKKNWSAGIGVEFKLFDGYLTKNKIRETKAALKKLETQQIILERGIALMVKHLFILIQSFQEQEKFLNLALQSSIENCELNTRAYQEELVETKDVIEAQLIESYMQAQYQKILYDTIESQAKLDFIIGTEINKLFSNF